MIDVDTTPHMQVIERRFQGLRWTIRGLFFGDGVARWILALCLFVVVTFTLDYLLDLPAGIRIVLLTGSVVSLGFVVWRRILRPLFVPIGNGDIALFVERQHPELEDRLISAIQFSRGGFSEEGNSPELVGVLLKEAEEKSNDLDFRKGLIYSPVAGICALAGLLILVFGSLVSLDHVLGPTHWGARLTPIYLNRVVGGSAAWPKKIRLQVLDFPGNRRAIAQGEDLVVAVRAEKQRAGVSAPSLLTLVYWDENGEGGELKEERVQDDIDLTWGEVLDQYQLGEIAEVEEGETEDGDLYFFRFEKVTAPFNFYVKGGGDRTGDFSVETRTPPKIAEKISAEYHYPSYLRLEDEVMEGGDISAPLHTSIEVVAETNIPVKEASLQLGLKGSEVEVKLTLEPVKDGGTRLTGTFQVTQAYSQYRFHLRGENGLENRGEKRDPREFDIHGMEDQPPRFKILDPLAENEDVTDICARPLLFRVVDDHGVASIQMEYQVIGSSQTNWIIVPVTAEMMGGERGETQKFGDKTIRVETLLDLKKTMLPGGTPEAPLRVKAGDHVRIRFRTRDYLDIGKPNETLSRLITLSVKSVGEIEKALQDEIGRLRDVLEVQERKQRAQYTRVGRLNVKWSSIDSLSSEGKREIRSSKLEQNGIVDRLVSVRTDIQRVMRRGVYNRIFTKDSADKLRDGIEVLTGLIGDPTRREKYGFALAAVQKLEEAGAAALGSERTARFRAAQDLQGQTIAGIQKVLDLLKKWASYQEIVRAFREALDIQKSVIEGIRSK